MRDARARSFRIEEACHSLVYSILSFPFRHLFKCTATATATASAVTNPSQTIYDFIFKSIFTSSHLFFGRLQRFFRVFN